MKQKIIIFFKSISRGDICLYITGLLLVLLLRYFLRGFETSDFGYYTSKWYGELRAGGFQALGGDYSNYTPFYLYLLYIISIVFPKMAPITATKLPSIAGDFICAWYVYRIVHLKYGKGPIPVLAFFCVLMAPTVVLNSAAWGQADSIYTAALIACIYYLLCRRNWLACIAFGVAFAIKFQSMYLVPFLLILFLKKEIALKYLFAIPAVYLVSIVPAWIAGRPLPELLMIYVSQVQGYEGLVHNATSVYTWLPLAEYETWYLPGVIFALCICFMYVFLVLKSRLKSLQSQWINLALLSVMIVPFFLPKTHDRYFYPADVLSIVYGFYNPGFFFIPILVNLASFFIYQPYLFGVDVFPQSLLTLVMFIAIVIVMWRVVVHLYPKNPSVE